MSNVCVRGGLALCSKQSATRSTLTRSCQRRSTRTQHSVFCACQSALTAASMAASFSHRARALPETRLRAVPSLGERGRDTRAGSDIGGPVEPAGAAGAVPSSSSLHTHTHTHSQMQSGSRAGIVLPRARTLPSSTIRADASACSTASCPAFPRMSDSPRCDALRGEVSGETASVVGGSNGGEELGCGVCRSALALCSSGGVSGGSGTAWIARYWIGADACREMRRWGRVQTCAGACRLHSCALRISRPMPGIRRPSAAHRHRRGPV